MAPRQFVAHSLLGSCLLAFTAGASPAMAAVRAPAAQSRASRETVSRKNQTLAKRQYRLGEQQFARGRYREALRAYERGYRLAKLPGFLLNMATCHVRLGERERARHLYELYLQRLPQSPRRGEVERAIAALNPPPRSKAPSEQPKELQPPPAPAPVVIATVPPATRDCPRLLVHDGTTSGSALGPAGLNLTGAPDAAAPERASRAWLVTGSVMGGLVIGAAAFWLGARMSQTASREGSLGTLSR